MSAPCGKVMFVSAAWLHWHCIGLWHITEGIGMDSAEDGRQACPQALFTSLCLVRLEACSWLWISSCYVEHILWRHSWYVRVNTLSSTMHHRIHQEVRRHSHMCISSCIILGFAYTTYRPIHIFLSFSLCNGKASTWKCISLTQAWPPFHVEARHEAHEKLHFGCWDPAKNEHF